VETELAKYTFKHRVEWSDRSETSPSHFGQLPIAVILPDNQRVGFGDHMETNFYPSNGRGYDTKAYAQIRPQVRIRLTTWGDDGSRRQGRAGETLDVLAPKGSRFIFVNHCPYCLYANGEQELPGLRYNERADDVAHPTCQAQRDEEDRLTREAYEESERAEEERWRALEAD